MRKYTRLQILRQAAALYYELREKGISHPDAFSQVVHYVITLTELIVDDNEDKDNA